MSFSREEVIRELVKTYVPPALEVQQWKAECEQLRKQGEYLAEQLRAAGQAVRVHGQALGAPANPRQGDQLRIDIRQLESLAHTDYVSPSSYPSHLVCLLPLARMLFPQPTEGAPYSASDAHTTLDKVRVSAVHKDAGEEVIRLTLAVLLQRWDDQGSCTVPVSLTIDLTAPVVNSIAADGSRPPIVTYVGEKNLSAMTPASLREWAM